MAMLQKVLDVLPLNDERRRFQRVRVNLLGRYMLADRREFPCQVVDMSPGDIAVEAPVTGEPGQRVVAYIDHLGRLEGTITRVFATGFAMSKAVSPSSSRGSSTRISSKTISRVHKNRPIAPGAGIAGRTFQSFSSHRYRSHRRT